MTVKAKALVPSTMLTTAAVVLYTVPASTKALIQKMTCVNNDTVARTVTIHLVAEGQSATSTNMLIKALPIAAGYTADISDAAAHLLEVGGTIQALASTSAVVSIRVSGVEIV